MWQSVVITNVSTPRARACTSSSKVVRRISLLSPALLLRRLKSAAQTEEKAAQAPAATSQDTRLKTQPGPRYIYTAWSWIYLHSPVLDISTQPGPRYIYTARPKIYLHSPAQHISTQPGPRYIYTARACSVFTFPTRTVSSLLTQLFIDFHKGLCKLLIRTPHLGLTIKQLYAVLFLAVPFFISSVHFHILYLLVSTKHQSILSLGLDMI